MRTWAGYLSWVMVVGIVGAATPMLLAAPPDREFLAAKQIFLKEIKKKDPVVRAAAVDAFVEFAHKETVDLLIKRGLSEEHSTVRDAIRRGLRKLAADETVSRYMLEEVRKGLKRHPGNETASVEILRALVSSTDDSLRTEIVKGLDEYFAANKANPLIPMTVIDELAVQGDQDAEQGVELLAKVNAFEKQFGYRRCVVQAMTSIRQPEAVDFLIELLPKTKGLVQHDVVDYLTRLTGQKFKVNQSDWSKWWKENRNEFSFPPAGESLAESTSDDGLQTYYRIPICAKRIVFVLDTSASMRGPPIVAAKQALLKALEALPEAVSFDVIMFDGTVTAWNSRLIPATREAKEHASQAVVDRGLNLGTASSAALDAAFGLEPEAIYFLSDGEPTDGAPDQIVDHITRRNRTRRVSIHTIGVVTQNNGAIGLTAFMQPLSEKNYGKFELVK